MVTTRRTRKIHHGGNPRRQQARMKLPKPPRLTRAEVEKRAASIARWWREEQRKMDEPLDPHAAGAVIMSLVREVSREWDGGYWRFRSAHECALEVVRRYRWDVPASIWDALSAWAFLDCAGAVRW